MTGIQSALQHDQIMDSASHDAVFVEREGKEKGGGERIHEKSILNVSSIATIIAERAAAALKESRRQRRQQDIGVPTWTGRSGAAGAPRIIKKINAFSSNQDKFGSGNVSGFKSTGATKPSSSSLLAKMRARRAMLEGDNATTEGK